MLGGDVADEFHDDDGLAHTGPAEQPYFPALLVGRQQVDDLDASFQNLLLGGLLDQWGCGAVNGVAFLDLHLPHLVHRIAQYVHDAAQNPPSNGHGDRCARIGDRDPPAQSVGGAHGHRPNGLVSQVLGHFQGDVEIVLFRIDPQGIQDVGHVPVPEDHVHDGSDDLDHLAHLAFCFGRHIHSLVQFPHFKIII